jgi:hypothetical protein
MSTPQGGGRRPSVIKVGGKPAPKLEDDLESTAAEPEAPDDDAEPEVPAKRTPRTAGTRTTPSRKAAAKAAASSSGGGRGAASSGGGRGTAASSGGGRGAAASAGRGAVAARPSKPAGRSVGKGSGRKPITAVKVGQGRNWGPIALFSAVGLIAVAIIGFAGWQVHQNSRTFDERAGDIPGVVNYRKTNPQLAKAAQHAWGPLKYPQSPPVGGTHNPNWQNCMGDVYDAQIANEHAVHAMEHGAVWVTYNPDKVSKADIATLQKKVRGKEYMLMSPYPNLDKPISLQAWGYQLKLTSAGDKRIDDFIKVMRHSAGIEQGAQCSGGITETGTTPRDLGKDQQSN